MSPGSFVWLQNGATMVRANRIGLRTMSLHVVCLSLFLNFSGIDPVDYMILVCLMFHFVSIGRAIFMGLSKPAILFAVFIFFSSYAISAFIGGFNTSFVINFIINVLLFLILVSYCTTSTRVKSVVSSLFAGFCLSVLIAALQILDVLALLPEQFDPIRHTRFFGLYGDPNLLGAAAVFFCIYWLNSMITIEKLKVPSILLHAAFFAISFLTLIFTQSRSAWGGFVIAMLTYHFFMMRGLRLQKAVSVFGTGMLLLGLVLITLYGSGGVELIESRLLTVSNRASEAEAERFGFLYTKVALDVVQANLIGVGPGNAADAMGLVNQDGGQIGAHNAFVQVAAENGWLAGLSFLYLVARLLLSSLKTSMNGRTPLGVSGPVMLASLLSLTFCGLFQDLIQWKVAWLVPALYVAMILHERRPNLGSRAATNQREGSSSHCDVKALNAKNKIDSNNVS